MRTDPDPGGSQLDLLGQYLDYQRKTILLGTTGSAASSLAKALAPELTLGVLLYQLALGGGCSALRLDR